MSPLIFAFFFLSGFSALVYETVWARQLVLVFGNTVYASSTILSVFFLGLAAGSYFFGRRIDRAEKPLKLYGFIELFTGLYCLLTPFLINGLLPIQAIFGRELFIIATIFLSMAVLVMPTFLLGGTFPVLAKFLSASKDRSKQVVSLLYALNTVGAVVGTSLTGFFFIPSFGLKETVWLAAGLNVFIGGYVLLFPKSFPQPEMEQPNVLRPFKLLGKANVDKPEILLSSKIGLIVAFLIGFSGLALEVLWTRVLILIFGSSTYAFTVILAVFLLGIGLGSFLLFFFPKFGKNSPVVLSIFLLVTGFLAILVTPFLVNLPDFFLSFYKQGGDFSQNLQGTLVTTLLVILPVTFLMGVSFILLTRSIVKDLNSLGSDLGRIYSLNTIGGVFGSLLAGFVLIPYLGFQKSILLVSLFYLLASILVVWSTKNSFLKGLLLLSSLILSGTYFFFPSWNKELLTSGVFIYFRDYLDAGGVEKGIGQDKTLYYKEGLTSTITVKENAQTRYLRINGKTDASNSSDLETVLLAGHLPLLLHPNPQNALVIGLGSGITLGAVEQYPLERIDLVEIEPAVVEAARYFNNDNHNALEDNRLTTYLDDGRHFLLKTESKYDVISSQPSNLWLAGMSNLFSREFYELASSRLSENGVMLQWVHFYSLNPADLKISLATFQAVFPYTNVWASPFSHSVLLIGSQKPLEISYPALKENFEREQVVNDLSRIELKQIEDVLGYFVADESSLKEYTADLLIHTDNKPILEFSAPFALGKQTVGFNMLELQRLQQTGIERLVSEIPKSAQQKNRYLFKNQKTRL